jgi:hypothetical protein
MGFFNKLKNQVAAEIKASLGGGSPPLTKEAFEESKPDELRKDIRMISGCADHQTSADVSNVSSFQLPDPAGSAGGALTSTLLKVLYADEQKPEEDLSFTEVLTSVRGHLKKGRYTQIPQLSSMNPIDLETKFDLVPDTATGVKRAVMIGINYVGQFVCCWFSFAVLLMHSSSIHLTCSLQVTVLESSRDAGKNKCLYICNQPFVSILQPVLYLTKRNQSYHNSKERCPQHEKIHYGRSRLRRRKHHRAP